MKIIIDKNNESKLNPLENQVEEINEWQKNANNPGYFIGSGKAPLPMKNILKSPMIMLIIGVIFAIPIIFSLVKNFSIETIFNNLVIITISIILIAGGIIRLLNKG
ncbi:MAG: hypothetical protein E7215_15185 [Clostridium sulfidigenes]|uniref:Uncharacterized protein n=1 Tax=Clostridium sulfidigenes TaxID=318464 RepID=A0A927WAX0_9CLOT|nr:hypothetical protein [Clostridium sulfidigenes]